MPAECSDGGVFGVIDGGQTMVALTFTRASSAWCTKADYSLVEVPAGQPRVMPGRTGAPLGLLVEYAAQNDVLQNSDLSQAVWTKSGSMACVKNAIGPDGVASSASTCTASAVAQTVTQAIVRAPAANSTSAYVRRRTGTGVVETLDVSGSYQAITSSLTTDWKRIVCLDTEGCMGGRCIVVPTMCATSTNPSVGFRLTTSGDAIEIAMAQNEAQLLNTSPIATAAVAASRVADLAQVALSASPVVVGSYGLSTVQSATLGTNRYTLQIRNGSGHWNSIYTAAPTIDNQNVGCEFSTGSYQSVGLAWSVGIPLGGVSRLACVAPTDLTKKFCSNGACNSAGAAGVAQLASPSAVQIGGVSGGTANNWQGVISQVCIGTGSECDEHRGDIYPADLHIVWLGDSITAGNNSAPSKPTLQLYETYARASSRMVINDGIAGNTSLGMANQYFDGLVLQPYRTLIWLGGINDVMLGGTAVSTWFYTKPVLDDALSRGWRVIPVLLLPWGSFAGWSAPKEAERVAYNVLLQAWCIANSMPCVDTDSMGSGSPLALLAGYTADGLHPNAAGNAALSSLVEAANP